LSKDTGKMGSGIIAMLDTLVVKGSQRSHVIASSRQRRNHRIWAVLPEMGTAN
jgi:hypothetical protein